MDEQISDLFMDKNVAVVGDLDNIGLEIIERLPEHRVRSIPVVDNREIERAYAMHGSLDDKLKLHLCDIGELDRVVGILGDVDAVFHAAALKHVSVCESEPPEAMKTNVVGTRHVIEACLQNEVEKMILVTRDRSVNPANVIDVTKLLAERIVNGTRSWGIRT